MTTTETKAKRTPGDIHVEGVPPGELRGGAAYVICLGGYGTIATLAYTEQGEANAEYICKAWNLHDELIRGIRRLRDDISLLTANHKLGRDPIVNKSVKFAKALLAKAQP